MTRPLRRLHFRIWLLLAPTILVGLLASIRYRPPPANTKPAHRPAEMQR